MQTPREPGSGDLAPGRHDAVVVDARWRTEDDPPVLELSLTLLAGALKGEVVEIGFTRGSAALGRALASLGADVAEPADPGAEEAVTAAVLGMPCTLVLARDADGNIGYALDP